MFSDDTHLYRSSSPAGEGRAAAGADRSRWVRQGHRREIVADYSHLRMAVAAKAGCIHNRRQVGLDCNRPCNRRGYGQEVGGQEAERTGMRMSIMEIGGDGA